MLTEGSFQSSAVPADLVERCWKKAATPLDWGLSPEQFRLLLERSVAQRFGGKQPDTKTIQAYCDTLHLTDLALAGACSAGGAAAWDFFVAQYRPELYRAARTIAGDSIGRDLADSLYADLYGLRESQGRRNSLFDYFHGRSKLGTWLRVILAQRHSDEFRRTRRMQPLAEDSAKEQPEGVPATKQSPAKDPHDPERNKFLAMLQVTLSRVLLELNPRERLRLAYYYVDELTLAQIGRLLSEHEATVSRKLDRTRQEVRKRVDTALLEDKNLSEAQLRLCYEYAREEWPFDLTGVLSSRQ